MSHELINAVDALVKRLETMGTQEDFKIIVEPMTSETISNDDLPRIRFFVTRTGSLDDVALGGRGEIKLNVLLRLSENPSFRLYNKSKTRGLLWLLEKVANCIDGSELSACGAWSLPPDWEIVDYVVNDTVLQFDLNVVLHTARFTRGEL